MSDKIKAAAESHAATDPIHFRSETIADFTAGAEYALKESGIDELREAAWVLAKSANDLDDVYVHSDAFKIKMDVLFDSADKCLTALSKSDLFFNDKNLKDGKE